MLPETLSFKQIYTMPKKIYYLLLLLMIVTSGCGEKQTASWITHPEVSEGENIWLIFRRNFTLNNSMSGDFLAHIAVDSKYWLWVNGELVVFEGGLKRGPDRNGIYYDVVDLKPFLHAGENNISLLMWHWGRHGFSHYNSGKAGLYFDMQNSRNSLVSDDSWKLSIHPSFGPSSPPFPNYRIPEFNIHFDARNNLEGWNTLEYNDEQWVNAMVIGNAGDDPFGRLVQRPFPLWRDSGLLDYESIEVIEDGDMQIIHAYLPKNIALTPYFRVNAPAGLLIDMRTDNYRGGSEYNVRTEYVTRDGVQEFETFGYINGHYVIYAFPAGVKILDLKYRDTRYNADYVAHFDANDPFWDILWEKSVTTMWLNIRDAIQDPDRERAQWWGDVVIVLGQMLYVLEDNGIPAIQKAIRNLVDWQKEDDGLYSPVPAGNWDAELPTQMLASVGKMGFWYYYQYTNDKELMQYVYPSVKRYLDLWELDEQNLVKHRRGGWTWLDWGERIDSALVFNTWYYMALEGVMGLAQLNNDSEYYQQLGQKREKLYEAFNTHLWDGTGYRSANYPYEYDDRGNGLAVLAGLADESKYPVIASILQNYFNSSPYIEKYVLESLFLMDMAELALTRMKNRYTRMVESPVTSLWEGWGIGPEGYGGGSYNHGWSGGGLTLLARYVAGISPLEPGFEKMQLRPQPGNLNRIKCRVNTVKGMVDVVWENSTETFVMKVDQQTAIPVVFHPPYESDRIIRSIYLDDELIWSENGDSFATRNVKVETNVNQRLMIEIADRTSWSIRVNYKN